MEGLLKQREQISDSIQRIGKIESELQKLMFTA
jgi:signal transduction histidine kinase